MIHFLKYGIACWVLSIPVFLFAQQKGDSIRTGDDAPKKGQLIETVSRLIIRSLVRKEPDTATVKSEEAFLPYEGKIIRKIMIKPLTFEKTVTDTASRMANTLTAVANTLHSNSKNWMIRNHLFIREGRPLNPYKLADNERYLRDLDFILDARFYIDALEHSDSVDVIVVTRDIFSLGGSIHPVDGTKTRFRLFDTNLGGWGQRLQFNVLLEEDRHPPFTYQFLYRKYSIGGSFITGEIGYTELNNGSSYGNEEEKAYYLRLDRPLVSPYTLFAGGIELSRNWSENFFRRDDFLRYRYTVNDAWLGYNIGASPRSQSRSRHFVALRTFHQHFTERPLQLPERNNALYNDRSFVLGGITFFKQNYYTTHYVYGFGRTEDIPYGHHISIYTGWTRQLRLKRAYMGVDIDRSVVNHHGDFYTLVFRAGGFINDDEPEDVATLLFGTFTSRLLVWDPLLIRQSVSAGVARIFNHRISVPLDINNEFGLRAFAADSLLGTMRFHINSETVVFTPLKLLGFRFAPFAFAEMAALSPLRQSQRPLPGKAFFGFGGGIRTRNENLVFGTVEFRVIYYPRTVENISTIAVSLRSNLRVKYSAVFVKRPDFVLYN